MIFCFKANQFELNSIWNESALYLFSLHKNLSSVNNYYTVWSLVTVEHKCFETKSLNFYFLYLQWSFLKFYDKLNFFIKQESLETLPLLITLWFTQKWYQNIEYLSKIRNEMEIASFTLNYLSNKKFTIARQENNAATNWLWKKRKI